MPTVQAGYQDVLVTSNTRGLPQKFTTFPKSAAPKMES